MRVQLKKTLDKIKPHIEKRSNELKIALGIILIVMGLIFIIIYPFREYSKYRNDWPTSLILAAIGLWPIFAGVVLLYEYIFPLLKSKKFKQIINTEEKIPIFTIEDSSWGKYGKIVYILVTGILILTLGLPLLFFSLLSSNGKEIHPFLSPTSIPFLVIIIFTGDWLIYYGLKIVFRNMKPFQITKITISDSEFKIYIQNKLYIQISLTEIEKIELIRHKWHLSRKINLIGPKIYKEILLFLFIFNVKKQKLVFTYLKQVATKIKIRTKERKEKFIEKDKIEEIQEDVKQFICSAR